MKFEIKNYNPSYQQQVESLHAAGLEIEGAFFDNPKLDNDLQNIPEIYQKNGTFLVGLLGKELVAMGALKKISDDIAEIKRFRVDYSYHQKGFGNLIYEKLEQSAISKKFKQLTLQTTSRQKSAITFYEKKGFILSQTIDKGIFKILEYEKNLFNYYPQHY